MINEKEIKAIAQLARLELGTQELQALAKDLVTILNYVDQLAQLDVSSVRLEQDAIRRHQREDVVEPGLSTQDDLLSLAPARQNKYIKVKSVFKHES